MNRTISVTLHSVQEPFSSTGGKSSDGGNQIPIRAAMIAPMTPNGSRRPTIHCDCSIIGTLETSPHLMAILTATRMSIPHSLAILPLKVENIPHLFAIYQPSNSHTRRLVLVLCRIRDTLCNTLFQRVLIALYLSSSQASNELGRNACSLYKTWPPRSSESSPM